ncbi:MAG: hypothetical protein COB04_15390 [Gammaproteobacteria bacterium]|nr:MAG: hypothetical protein COB04_15390 [Gammaproteobacteria bacterium]
MKYYANFLRAFSYGVLTFGLILQAPQRLSAEEYQPVEWQLPSARFADLKFNPTKIAKITQGGQFVIVANPKDFKLWNARKNKVQLFENKRVTYVATVIDAPIEEVRAMAWDFEGQEKFSPLLEDIKVLSEKENLLIGSYQQTIKVPVIKLVSDFVVQFNKHENGDIGMLLIDEGDVEAMFHYWEFFPLDDQRTLTVLSGWQDTDSADFMYKVVLEAEPALGKVFPILNLYERIVQFKDEAARRHPDVAEKPDEGIYDIRSINGYISDNSELDMEELRNLTKLGSVQFYQKSRKLSHDGEMYDIYQVSAIQYIPLPQETIQPLLNNFDSLAEYNEVTYGWLTPDETKEDWSHLQIAVRFGPLKIPVEIYIDQERVDENKMLFHSHDHGYMHPLTGHIEYLKMPQQSNDEGTIVSLTIGGVIGSEASFLFKLMRKLPFYNVFIAAGYGMITADSMDEWVVERVAKDNAQESSEQVVVNFKSN